MKPEEEIEQSEVKKRILAKKKVQEEMDDLRKQIRQLRKKQESGESVDQDIEANLGYLKVLKKEMHSIKEGSHTTFLTAKQYISPKLNYGSKKKELLENIKLLAKEIREGEKKLTGGGFSSDQRQSIQQSLMDSKAKHQDAMLELKAIEQFNHTRFLEHKAVEANSKQDEPLDILSPEENAPPQDTPSVKDSKENNYPDFNPPPMI